MEIVAIIIPTPPLVKRQRFATETNRVEMGFVLVGSFAVCYKRFREEDPLGSHDPARSLFNSFHL
jgi:hypothetical protein